MAKAKTEGTTDSITLAHHWSYDGKDYQPGDTLTVSADTARELRAAGYVAGVDPSDPTQQLTTSTGTANL